MSNKIKKEKVFESLEEFKSFYAPENKKEKSKKKNKYYLLGVEVAKLACDNTANSYVIANNK